MDCDCRLWTILPGKLLDVAQFAVNNYASLLPKYRSGAPIHYAIMKAKEAGVPSWK
ncbi:MAG: hypothetical protein ACLT64_05190 [Streptococcus salivarius]